MMIKDGLLVGSSSSLSSKSLRMWHLQFGFSSVNGELPAREDWSWASLGMGALSLGAGDLDSCEV